MSRHILKSFNNDYIKKWKKNLCVWNGMEKVIFECEGPSGKIEFEIDGETFRIREPGEHEFQFASNTLLWIKYRNNPWILENNGLCFRLSFTWMNSGGARKRDILLFHDRQANTDLILFLKSHYPDQCLIGPNEKERRTLLEGSAKNVYRLYNLALATTLGIISAILIIQIIFLYLSLSTSQFVVVSNPDTFYRAGKILVIITLIPLGLLILIIKKRLMVVKTDGRGITIQRFFTRKILNWEEILPGNAREDTSSIYTGLFCYYSDKVNILATSSLIEVCLKTRAGAAIFLKMAADEAGRLYRELYYREKVSLEEASQVKAFL
jgi:hypothetical protein